MHSASLVSCRQPSGSIPLMPWQTAVISGTCQILWALGGWSTHSIIISLLSPNSPAFFLHDHIARAWCCGSYCYQFSTTGSLQKNYVCTVLWFQKPWEGSQINNQLQIAQNTHTGERLIKKRYADHVEICWNVGLQIKCSIQFWSNFSEAGIKHYQN